MIDETVNHMKVKMKWRSANKNEDVRDGKMLFKRNERQFGFGLGDLTSKYLNHKKIANTKISLSKKTSEN